LANYAVRESPAQAKPPQGKLGFAVSALIEIELFNQFLPDAS
jgi:hypothetical protein